MCQNADKALHTLKIKECNHMDTTKEEAVLIATLFEEIDKSSSSSVKIEDNCELGELGVISEIPIVACKQIQPIVASSYAKLNEYFHKAHKQLLTIIGKTENFNFIDELFKSFCVGK